jgi:hypothetical protein
MKRTLACLTVLLVVAGAAQPVRAESNPTFNVTTYGLELCSQDMCGAAIFAGVVVGRVNGNPAAGTFAVAVTHDPLPEPYHVAAITGGQFEFRIGLRRISGIVEGGTLYNTGQNTFVVHSLLKITRGGSGSLVYDGLLDHNVFPPTVVGTVVTQ